MIPAIADLNLTASLLVAVDLFQHVLKVSALLELYEGIAAIIGDPSVHGKWKSG